MGVRTLEQMRNQIATCMRCGNCQAVCPVYREVPREPAVARGKVALAAALDLCLTCTACVDACPSGVAIEDIILAARAEIVARRGQAWMKAAIFAAVKRPRALSAGAAFAARVQGLALGAGPDPGLGAVRWPVPHARRPIVPRLPSEPLLGRSEDRAGPVLSGRRAVFYPVASSRSCTRRLAGIWLQSSGLRLWTR